MPFATITTNILKSQLPKAFKNDAVTALAEICGCPVSNFCVIINAEADIGTCEPADDPVVFVLVRGDAFSKEKNVELFKKASDFFVKSLGVQKEGVYVEFFQRDPDFCSLGGMSMTQIREMFKNMGAEHEKH